MKIANTSSMCHNQFLGFHCAVRQGWMMYLKLCHQHWRRRKPCLWLQPSLTCFESGSWLELEQKQQPRLQGSQEELSCLSMWSDRIWSTCKHNLGFLFCCFVCENHGIEQWCLRDRDSCTRELYCTGRTDCFRCEAMSGALSQQQRVLRYFQASTSV